MSAAVVALATCLVAITACSTTRPQESVAKVRLQTVEFKMTEQADDGRYPVQPNRRQKVDPDSSLVIDFMVDTSADAAPPDPKWKFVNNFMQEVDELAAELIVLNQKTVAANDLEAARALRTETNSFNRRVEDLNQKGNAMLTELLESQGYEGTDLEDRIDAIKLGEYDGREPTTDNPLVNMAAYLVDQLPGLRARAEALRSPDKKEQVRVLAFHKRGAQVLEQIHVENYDNIAAQVAEPQDRYSFGLSQADLAHLKSDIAQAERASRVIRRLDEKAATVKSLHKEILAEMRKLLNQIRSDADQFVEGFDEAVAFLEGLKDDEAYAADAAKITALIESTTKIRDLWRKAEALQATFDTVIDGMDSGSLAGLLAGAADALEAISTLTREVESIGGMVAEAKSAVEGLWEAADGLLATERDKADWLAMLPESLSSALVAYCDGVTDIVDLFEAVAQSITRSAGSSAALAELAGAGDQSISRSLGNLLPATIELRPSVQPGDGVVVRVELLDADGETIESIAYNLAVRHQGVYREISGQAILTRGIDGTSEAKDWSPNVAVLASWFNQVRDPNKLGRFWNGLNPGLGFHAASLDQGDDNVEFGLGANLMLWDGLFFAGYGYDLNVDDDREYVFLGTDLLKLLGSLQSSFESD